MNNIPIFPTMNATLNFTAFIFLLLGWLAIKAGKRELHRKMMMGALTASGLFLISYISYHALIHGVTKYKKEGILHTIYLLILIPHTLLAIAIIPFCIAAVRYAFRGEYAKHTQITRRLLPVWMYVSLTGVIIYLMLYIF